MPSSNFFKIQPGKKKKKNSAYKESKKLDIMAYNRALEILGANDNIE